MTPPTTPNREDWAVYADWLVGQGDPRGDYLHRILSKGLSPEHMRRACGAVMMLPTVDQVVTREAWAMEIMEAEPCAPVSRTETEAVYRTANGWTFGAVVVAGELGWVGWVQPPDGERVSLRTQPHWLGRLEMPVKPSD